MSEIKKSNINSYINKLRIDFAINKIYNDRNWHKYKIDEIASSCGFSNRQSFSNCFYELKQIRPTDFIKKRIQELKGKKDG